jgi:hypothetical protein
MPVAGVHRWSPTQPPSRPSPLRPPRSQPITIRDAPEDFGQLARDHATSGGINENFSAMLSRAGAYELVDSSLQIVLEGLRTETRSSAD